MDVVNVASEGDEGGPPPPSPLTGCYLLIVVGEPQCQDHKEIILQRIAKGLLSWNLTDCLVDLEKELAIITEQALKGEEARYGEKLIQFASENLVTEILIHPVASTLAQCIRNLLSSFTRHRHIIHAGYTFAANGSWVLQDGTFSLSDFSEAFQELEVQRVIHAYENGITLNLHCSPEGDWSRLTKELFTKACKVRVNPTDVLTSGSPTITNFINYLSPSLVSTSLENLLESSDVVGNIRFSRPTLYVFPGGQGDAALFGINGFNMLLDGGFSRKACFWDFVRHLDRLDAVLMTRLNNSNVCGISSVLKRKTQDAVYPQLGHFFCNIQERKALLSPDDDKDKNPLLINLLDEGHEIISNLRHLNLNPQVCYRDSEPINLYHKVGHGTLDMYVLSPAKDSQEVKEFLLRWNQSDQKLFDNAKSTSREFNFPIQNLVSIAALLVWQPANPNENITRILYPGSTPQKKIFEGLDRLKNLEFVKHSVCSEKSLTSVSSVKKIIKEKDAIIEKVSPKDKAPSIEKKENKIIENKISNEDVKEKKIQKYDSTESEKSNKTKKTEDLKFKNGYKPKQTGTRPARFKSDSQQEKKQGEKKLSTTTPMKPVENGDEKEVGKAFKTYPIGSPAKHTKDANNRKVIQSKTKREAFTKPFLPALEPKAERKPISRRPKSVKAPISPVKKTVNGVQKQDIIFRKGKFDKKGITDLSTVSTPSADQDIIPKKEMSKLTPADLQQLKAQELDDLKEEQEAVKEIEAVFRKGELKSASDENQKQIKKISMDKDKLEKEEYLIIKKEEIDRDSLDKKDINEDETQKHARDSEESEKQRKLSSEEMNMEKRDLDIKEKVNNIVNDAKDIVKAKEKPTDVRKDAILSSPENKIDQLTDKKTTGKETEEEPKNVMESQPDEKVSGTIKSGDTTTAPTLPEDERIPLDEIKEDNGQVIIKVKHTEETKEKDIPIIKLPPKTFESVSSANVAPNVGGIRLDNQSHIRDIVKTPDEVADLPVHEEVDYEYSHEIKTNIRANEVIEENTQKEEKIHATHRINADAVVKIDEHIKEIKQNTDANDKVQEELQEITGEVKKMQDELKNLTEIVLQNEMALEKDILKNNKQDDKEPLKSHINKHDDILKKKNTEKKIEQDKKKTIQKIDSDLTKETINTKETEDRDQTVGDILKKAEVEIKEKSDKQVTKEKDNLEKYLEKKNLKEGKEEALLNGMNEKSNNKKLESKVKPQKSLEITKKENVLNERLKKKKEIKTKAIGDDKFLAKQVVTPDTKNITSVREIKTELEKQLDEKIKATNEEKDKMKKIDDKLQKLKDFSAESKIESAKLELKDLKLSTTNIKQLNQLDDKLKQVKKETSAEKIEKDELEIIALNEKIKKLSEEPIEKLELKRKSPKEREEDVIKIVASVAEVLKSDAPLEEFEEKIPITTYDSYSTTSYTAKLRETHITTVDSPVIESRHIKTDDIPSIPEEPHQEQIEGNMEDKRSSIFKESQELMLASPKTTSGIKVLKTEEDNEEAGIVHRMLVTASSEDGGAETEICTAGTIIFLKSSESSGRSAPEQSQRTSQKSFNIDTVSYTESIVNHIKEINLEKDLGLNDVKSDTEKKVVDKVSKSSNKENGKAAKKKDEISPLDKSKEVLSTVFRKSTPDKDASIKSIASGESTPDMSDLDKSEEITSSLDDLKKTKGLKKYVDGKFLDSLSKEFETANAEVPKKKENIEEQTMKVIKKKKKTNIKIPLENYTNMDLMESEIKETNEEIINYLKSDLENKKLENDVEEVNELTKEVKKIIKDGQIDKIEGSIKDTLDSASVFVKSIFKNGEEENVITEIKEVHVSKENSQQTIENVTSLSDFDKSELTELFNKVSADNKGFKDSPVKISLKSKEDCVEEISSLIYDTNLHKEKEDLTSGKDQDLTYPTELGQQERKDIFIDKFEETIKDGLETVSDLTKSIFGKENKDMEKAITDLKEIPNDIRKEAINTFDKNCEQPQEVTNNKEKEDERKIKNVIKDKIGLVTHFVEEKFDLEILKNDEIDNNISTTPIYKLLQKNKDICPLADQNIENKVVEKKEISAKVLPGAKKFVSTIYETTDPIYDKEAFLKASENKRVVLEDNLMEIFKDCKGGKQEKNNTNKELFQTATDLPDNKIPCKLEKAKEFKYKTVGNLVEKKVETTIKEINDELDSTTTKRKEVVKTLPKVQDETKDIKDVQDKIWSITKKKDKEIIGIDNISKQELSLKEHVDTGNNEFFDEFETGIKDSLSPISSFGKSLVNKAQQKQQDTQKSTENIAERIMKSSAKLNFGSNGSEEQTEENQNLEKDKFQVLEDKLKDNIGESSPDLGISYSSINLFKKLTPNKINNVLDDINVHTNLFKKSTPELKDNKNDFKLPALSSGNSSPVMKDEQNFQPEFKKAVSNRLPEESGRLIPENKIPDAKLFLATSNTTLDVKDINSGNLNVQDFYSSTENSGRYTPDLKTFNNLSGNLTPNLKNSDLDDTYESRAESSRKSTPDLKLNRNKITDTNLDIKSIKLSLELSEKNIPNIKTDVQNTSTSAENIQDSFKTADEMVKSIAFGKCEETNIKKKYDTQITIDDTQISDLITFNKSGNKEPEQKMEIVNKYFENSAEGVGEALNTVRKMTKSISFDKCAKVETQIVKKEAEYLKQSAGDIIHAFDTVKKMSESISFGKCEKTDVKVYKTDAEHIKLLTIDGFEETSEDTTNILTKLVPFDKCDKVSDKEEKAANDIKAISKAESETYKNNTLNESKSLINRLPVEEQFNRTDDLTKTFSDVTGTSKIGAFEKCDKDEQKEKTYKEKKVKEEIKVESKHNKSDGVDAFIPLSNTNTLTTKTGTKPSATNTSLSDLKAKDSHVKEILDKVNDNIDNKSIDIAISRKSKLLEKNNPSYDNNLDQQDAITNISKSLVFEKEERKGMEKEKDDILFPEDLKPLPRKKVDDPPAKKSSLDVVQSDDKKLSISEVDISFKESLKILSVCSKDASSKIIESEKCLVHSDEKTDTDKDINKSIFTSIPGSSVFNTIKDKKQNELHNTLLHEKHISGAVTPLTVPASPNVIDLSSDNLKPTSRMDVLIKEINPKSFTSDSNDFEMIASTQSDIPAEEILEMPLDSGKLDSDEEDQLSVTSQIAHFRESSQYDFGEEKTGNIDSMSMSFNGSLLGEQVDVKKEPSYLYEITKAKYGSEKSLDKVEAKISAEFSKKNTESLMTAIFIRDLPSSSSREQESKDSKKKTKDPMESWSKPLGLPSPIYLYEVTKAKYSSGITMDIYESDDSSKEFKEIEETYLYEVTKTQYGAGSSATLAQLSKDLIATSFYESLPSNNDQDPISSWGKPLGLPTPASSTDKKGTPKKERKISAHITAKNKLNNNKKRSVSPSKNKTKKIIPVYVDLTYVPHHGNSFYSYVDFFKKIRARYYVFSGIEPRKEVYNALLEAKQAWENKELEVTIIPTYDTDILGYWVAENEELLAKYKIDLSPSASRCTINLQDHETSCSAYRLEF